MERRILLKLAIGIAAGAALTASVCAAPLSPHSIAGDQLSPPAREQLEPRPAVTSPDEVNRLQPEQVHWGHHWHHR